MPQTLWGLPVVVSDNSPQQITLVDASQILYSDTGGIEFDLSEQAAIQMDSAPVTPAVAATVLVSLYQVDLVGFKATRWLAYQRARDGSVSYMTVAY